MKKIHLVFITLLFAFTINAQTPLLIEEAPQGFGELFLDGTTLIRSGLNQEAALVAIDNPNFPSAVIASGLLTDNSFLRAAINEDATQMYLSDFNGQLWEAPLNGSAVPNFTPLGTFELEVAGMDYYNDKVYFTTTAPQIISFNPDDADNSLQNFYEPSSPLPIFNTEIIGDFLYYSSQSSFTAPIDFEIFRLDLTSANPQPELVAITPDKIITIAKNGGFLYLGSNENNAVYRADINGVFPATVATVFTSIIPENESTLFSIVHDGIFFYFSTDDGLYRINDPLLSVSNFDISEIKVYPNPASSIVSFSKDEQIVNARVYDYQGKLVVSCTTCNEIAIDNLEEGVYLLKMKTITGNFTTKKLVIKK
ncbi:T9SS type A sorting domain-containing protein [Patiriisocius marinus]|uniref:T9SS type A sorting domain-containing protein n=1 Tax=Patiriisocius marinus TaxID=1397112 RepID=UPI00232E6101|nr:T9SS type A sorting domain-containing protein [Patiriisocius marinus]